MRCPVLIRNLRKTIDIIASRNEDAAIAVMRAAEKVGDELLRQQLFNVIHCLNQDAADLRAMRDQLEGGERKRA